MAVAISNNGKHVYLTIRSLNQVIQFDRDSNRKRSLANPVYYTDQLNAVNSVALDGEGTYIYFTSSDPFITFYQRDGRTGQLSNQQNVALQLSNHLPFSGTSLLVGPNDAFVYVASHESHVLQVFRRKMNGGLALVQSVSIFYPIDLAVSLDGTSIYVACSGIASNAAAGTLKSFQRNTTNGTLFDRFQWDVGENTNLKGWEIGLFSSTRRPRHLCLRPNHRRQQCATAGPWIDSKFTARVQRQPSGGGPQRRQHLCHLGFNGGFLARFHPCALGQGCLCVWHFSSLRQQQIRHFVPTSFNSPKHLHPQRRDKCLCCGQCVYRVHAL